MFIKWTKSEKISRVIPSFRPCFAIKYDQSVAQLYTNRQRLHRLIITLCSSCSISCLRKFISEELKNFQRVLVELRILFLYHLNLFLLKVKKLKPMLTLTLEFHLRFTRQGLVYCISKLISVSWMEKNFFFAIERSSSKKKCNHGT